MISIVIITCNRKMELCNAILSCLGKSAELCEIIIIDNNSIDNSRYEVEKLEKNEKIKVKYIFNTINAGVAGARNQGYKIASGDIIYFLDDDAILKSRDYCISIVADFMRKNINFPFLTTEIYNVTTKSFQNSAIPVKNKIGSEGEVFYFIGASHFINKGTLGDIQLYPNEFTYGGEEYYLSFKFKNQKLGVFYYPNMKVDHIPSSFTRLSVRQTNINNYSNAFNVKRYFTPLIFLPIIWFVMLIRIFFLGYNNNLLEYLKDFKIQIGLTYNSLYREPLKIIPYIKLIKKYGLYIIF